MQYRHLWGDWSTQMVLDWVAYAHHSEPAALLMLNTVSRYPAICAAVLSSMLTPPAISDQAAMVATTSRALRAVISCGIIQSMEPFVTAASLSGDLRKAVAERYPASLRKRSPPPISNEADDDAKRNVQHTEIDDNVKRRSCISLEIFAADVTSRPWPEGTERTVTVRDVTLVPRDDVKQYINLLLGRVSSRTLLTTGPNDSVELFNVMMSCWSAVAAYPRHEGTMISLLDSWYYCVGDDDWATVNWVDIRSGTADNYLYDVVVAILNALPAHDVILMAPALALVVSALTLDNFNCTAAKSLLSSTHSEFSWTKVIVTICSRLVVLRCRFVNGQIQRPSSSAVESLSVVCCALVTFTASELYDCLRVKNSVSLFMGLLTMLHVRHAKFITPHPGGVEANNCVVCDFVYCQEMITYLKQLHVTDIQQVCGVLGSGSASMWIPPIVYSDMSSCVVSNAIGRVHSPHVSPRLQAMIPILLSHPNTACVLYAELRRPDDVAVIVRSNNLLVLPCVRGAGVAATAALLALPNASPGLLSSCSCSDVSIVMSSWSSRPSGCECGNCAHNCRLALDNAAMVISNCTFVL